MGDLLSVKSIPSPSHPSVAFPRCSPSSLFIPPRSRAAVHGPCGAKDTHGTRGAGEPSQSPAVGTSSFRCRDGTISRRNPPPLPALGQQHTVAFARTSALPRPALGPRPYRPPSRQWSTCCCFYAVAASRAGCRIFVADGAKQASSRMHDFSVGDKPTMRPHHCYAPMPASVARPLPAPPFLVNAPPWSRLTQQRGIWPKFRDWFLAIYGIGLHGRGLIIVPLSAVDA